MRNSITTIMTTMLRYNHTFRLLPLLLLLIAFIAPQSVSARKKSCDNKNHSEMMRELQEFKIKYIIQEAEITKEQQTEFIKIYTEMNNAKMAVFKEYHAHHKALKDKSNPTDEEYNAVSEEMAGAKSAEGAIEKTYYLKFKQLLTPKQLYKMKEAEMGFNRKMMHMRKNKN